MSEEQFGTATRADCLKQLGLGEHATWEEVQSAYARLLEQAVEERGESARVDEVERLRLQTIEDAFQFLLQDPVIQARRVTGPRKKPFPRLVPAHISSSTAENNFSSLPLAALVLGTIVFISGILAYVAKSAFSSEPQTNISALPLPADTLQEVRRENEELSERIRELGTRFTLISEENERLREEMVRHFSGNPPPEVLAEAEEQSDTPLINLVPPAFTERDKMYVVRHTGEVEETYTMLTPGLIDAGIRCDLGLAEALISDGADINELDARGDSALAWAVKRNCPQVVNLLLTKGAAVNSRSDNGFTPFLWARIYGNVRMQRLLKAAGADTSVGAYWRRLSDDGKEQYLDHALQAACRDPLAPGCRG